MGGVCTGSELSSLAVTRLHSSLIPMAFVSRNKRFLRVGMSSESCNGEGARQTAWLSVVPPPSALHAPKVLVKDGGRGVTVPLPSLWKSRPRHRVLTGPRGGAALGRSALTTVGPRLALPGLAEGTVK